MALLDTLEALVGEAAWKAYTDHPDYNPATLERAQAELGNARLVAAGIFNTLADRAGGLGRLKVDVLEFDFRDMSAAYRQRAEELAASAATSARGFNGGSLDVGSTF